MNYTHILFDADNTLFDFHWASKKSFETLMMRHTQNPKVEWYEMYNAVNMALWKDLENDIIDGHYLRKNRFKPLLDELNISVDPFEMNRAYLDLVIENTQAYQDTVSTLEILKNQIKMSVITNGLSEAQRPRLSKTGLTEYFDHIFISDELGFHKPSYRFFDYVYKHIADVPKSKILVVGDSEQSDIIGGLNYGFKTCHIDVMSSESTYTGKADYHVKSLSQLLDIIF